MSKEDDAVFLRNFGLVLLGLVVIAFLAFFLARAVTSNAQGSNEISTVQIEPASPVG